MTRARPLAAVRENENVHPTVIARRSRRAFLPAGAATGIGSLPFTSAPEAIEAIAASSPRIPFWPQLPKLSARESIIGQGLDALSHLLEPRDKGYGYKVKEGKIDQVVGALHRSGGELTAANAVGFESFQDALPSGVFDSAIAVKGQIEGPITLSTYLFYRERPFLSDRALFAAIAFHVSQIVCWQIDRLKAAGLPVILFIDEPGLCLESPSGNVVSEDQRLAALAAVLNGARIRGAYAGLHCCAAGPFSRMCRAQPDILSFDAHQGLEQFFSDADARTFARNGGTVAYGLIPTWQDLGKVNPARVFAQWLTLASLVGDLQMLARNAMITATCGLGFVRPEGVTQSFALAHSVGKLIHALAGAPEPFPGDHATVSTEATGS